MINNAKIIGMGTYETLLKDNSQFSKFINNSFVTQNEIDEENDNTNENEVKKASTS